MQIVRKACIGLLRIGGWSSEFRPYPGPKGLIFVYPHTSNWDFIIGVLFRVGHGLKAHWMGKDTMFFWPLAGLFKRIGGLPINRRERTGFVGAMVEEFRRRDFLWIAVAPEGTRSHTDHLKSGFYRVAREADVPLGLAYIDYGRRRIALEDYVRMTGDEARDLATLRDFYADKRGRHPAKAGDIRFRTPTPDVIEP